MAQTSFPFENIDTSETQFSQWARNIGEGVKTDSLNELEVYGDSSGMQVKVKTGQAMVRGHYYTNTAEEILAVSAANPSNPRIDIVILELDPSANSIILKVVAGTPAVSPTAPSLVQTDGGVYQIKLAQIAVAAGATTITSGNVSDYRTYLVTTAELQTQIDAKAPLTPAVNAKTGTYTLVVGDRGEFITASGTFTITVPNSVFTAGDRVDFVNIGSGTITFAAGAGLTLSSKDAKLTIAKQYAAATVFFTSASAAILVGDLA